MKDTGVHVRDRTHRNRKEEIRKVPRSKEKPRTKEDMNRYPRARKQETGKDEEKIVAENVELVKEGRYKCGQCFQVRPLPLLCTALPDVSKIVTVRDLFAMSRWQAKHSFQ